MISFNSLEVGHLPKQQVVASENPRQGFERRFPCGILILLFDYTLGISPSPWVMICLILSELFWRNRARDHLHLRQVASP
jgi:hypothetical protein